MNDRCDRNVRRCSAAIRGDGAESAGSGRGTAPGAPGRSSARPLHAPGSAGIFKANADLQAVLKKAIAEDQRHGRRRRSPSPISTG